MKSETARHRCLPPDTERLRLRELGVDDADFMLALLNDEAFLRNVGDRGVRTLDDARAYIVNSMMISYAQHGFGFWCVVERSSGARTGICGLARRDNLDAVDIGFAFLPEFRSKGYAFESASAVMLLAREELGLHSHRRDHFARQRRFCHATGEDRPALRAHGQGARRRRRDLPVFMDGLNRAGVDRLDPSPQTSPALSSGV